MTLPPELQQRVEWRLGEPVRAAFPLGGGCIANATRIETATARYFLKWGPSPVGDTFFGEAFGLRLLRETATSLRVPEPLAIGAPGTGKPGYLLLEWNEPGAWSTEAWEQLGRGLAELHSKEGEAYGAGKDTCIGRLPQANGWMDRWPDFFRERRLEPQVQRACRRPEWDGKWDRALERLYEQLDVLLPIRPERSLVHGDLWSGNVMVSASQPVLIDPAAHYGHREVDLAMTELFGGFPQAFYGAYREAWPLDGGYEERRAVYNLYHLLNHLNHFGGGYASAVASVLERFRR